MTSGDTTASETSILFDTVRFSRGSRTVLAGISGHWKERRIGLIGRNGSGKSTLARLLNGLLQPASGRIRVHGRDPASGPESMSDSVGFIFQNPDHQIIFPTVDEELCFGLRNKGLSRTDAKAAAHAALADWGLQDWTGAPVHSLSEGQKQLICLLSVLILKPGLLILDEPFAALDLATQHYLNRLLAALPQQIVMITHDLASLRHYDRILWLEEGQVFGDGSPADLLADYFQVSERIARSRDLPGNLADGAPVC